MESRLFLTNKLLLWISLLGVSVPWQTIVSEKLIADEYLVKIVLVVSVVSGLEDVPSNLMLGRDCHSSRKVVRMGSSQSDGNRILDCTEEYAGTVLNLEFRSAG
jgi:hypothetical protein